MAVDYLDKSSERKNTGKTFNIGKMPLGGGSLLFHSTSMSRFLQSLANLFCQQLESHQKSACLLRQLEFQIPWQMASAPSNHGERMGGILQGLQVSANQQHKVKGLFIPLFLHLESKGNSCRATQGDKPDYEHKCQILYKNHHQTPEIQLALRQERAGVKYSEYLRHSETAWFTAGSVVLGRPSDSRVWHWADVFKSPFHAMGWITGSVSCNLATS